MKWNDLGHPSQQRNLPGPPHAPQFSSLYLVGSESSLSAFILIINRGVAVPETASSRTKAAVRGCGGDR